MHIIATSEGKAQGRDNIKQRRYVTRPYCVPGRAVHLVGLVHPVDLVKVHHPGISYDETADNPLVGSSFAEFYNFTFHQLL